MDVNGVYKPTFTSLGGRHDFFERPKGKDIPNLVCMDYGKLGLF